MLSTLQPSHELHKVRFRVKDDTTSATIQKDLYNALERALSAEQVCASEWLCDLAKLAYRSGCKRVSSYLTEQAYLQLMPSALMQDYHSNLHNKQIRVFVSGRHNTTITMPAVLLHYLEATDQVPIAKQLVVQYKSLGVKKLSAAVRWHIINYLIPGKSFH